MQKVCLKSLQEDAADNINRRHFQMRVFGTLRIKSHIKVESIVKLHCTKLCNMMQKNVRTWVLPGTPDFHQ